MAQVLGWNRAGTDSIPSNGESQREDEDDQQEDEAAQSSGHDVDLRLQLDAARLKPKVRPG